MRPPHEVMALPAGQLGETLVADGAEAVLLLPQAKDLPLSLQLLSHTDAQSGFKVRLPFRIIRISLAFDFRVPSNRHTGGTEQAHVLVRPSGTRDVTTEHPVVPVLGSEVFLLDPAMGFVRVSPPCPLPRG